MAPITSERRFIITVLIGPCTDAEAETLLEDLADEADERFGAVVSMQVVAEEDTRGDPDAAGLPEPPCAAI